MVEGHSLDGRPIAVACVHGASRSRESTCRIKKLFSVSIHIKKIMMMI